jgi:hypothetical protein
VWVVEDKAVSECSSLEANDRARRRLSLGQLEQVTPNERAGICRRLALGIRNVEATSRTHVNSTATAQPRLIDCQLFVSYQSLIA